MFNDLIESRHQRQQGFGGSIVSVVLHAAAITLAMYVTAHAGEEVRASESPEVPITYVPMQPSKTPPALRTAPRPRDDGISTLPPQKTFRPLVAPDVIPTSIPIVDLSNPVTDASDFRETGAPARTGDGIHDGTLSSGAHPYSLAQVDKPAIERAGNRPPAYPSMLERSRIEGDVLAQFVVDTMGRADMGTFMIVHASNALFGAALAAVLPSWRFYPAQAGGHKVKQIVQLPLTFVAPLR
jgi:periplasmic protein TonB